ncbi:MAG: NAD(P)H-dependent oxidoreductase subunit E, partial [Firmicutes bacterium]|nr:NAD(P)H-dependent oxidoreductase subunit E [Bacillota bacterium]
MQIRQKINNIKSSGGSIVMALQAVQEEFKYLPEEYMTMVAEIFNVSPAKVFGVATFYHQFSLKAKGQNIISVCMGTACYIKKADVILADIEKYLGIKAGCVTTDGLFSIEHNTRCVGDCSRAPIVLINDLVLGNTNTAEVIAALKKIKLNA